VGVASGSAARDLSGKEEIGRCGVTQPGGRSIVKAAGVRPQLRAAATSTIRRERLSISSLTPRSSFLTHRRGISPGP